VNRPAPIDSSYLIDLERETAAGDLGPARRFLPSLRGRRIVVSIVSVESSWKVPSTRRPRSRRCSASRVRGWTSRRHAAAP
jgi:hypothetical protein